MMIPSAMQDWLALDQPAALHRCKKRSHSTRRVQLKRKPYEKSKSSDDAVTRRIKNSPALSAGSLSDPAWKGCEAQFYRDINWSHDVQAGTNLKWKVRK